ncbi:MAG: histidine kinase [Ornithinimicrobium sp.]|uniref:sensor histidine kinase n=1 Tax=Ornithinimicrobium sp. TaxID=1977084 RepID=UPI0026E06377|nr:histidine kinase [Ornithinimicrobium sp.]MDO5739887.1 histidine kinase [Ornithinimicrobium sp.]
MRRALGWLPAEAGVEDPPARAWRDWLLAAVVAGVAAVEVLLRDDLSWRPLSLVLGLVLALSTLWRRTQPLAMATLGFGSILIVDLATALTHSEPVILYSSAVVLVLVYAIFRWGSGPAAALGLMVVLAEWLVATITDYSGLADAGGGLIVLLFFAALGLSVRYRHIAGAQQLEGVRSHERETLARELHDTVAHHVAAITISAQAGRVLAGSNDLSGAASSLAVIEEEASRALAEMRLMVGSLRRGRDNPTMLPPRSVADFDEFAAAEGGPGLRVEVTCRGDLDDLRPSIATALYRIAQESITNVHRHARHATRVEVLLAGGTESVRLSITDDGARALSTLRAPGYGLVGMAERVALLGGSLEAGPRPDGGWMVQADIPRQRELK